MIQPSDIDRLSQEILKLFPDIEPVQEYDWKSPALNILDCVLSLNRNYELVVKPRIIDFKNKHPDCYSIQDLLALIDKYKHDYVRFTTNELNLNHADRGRIIDEVCQYLLIEISSYKDDDQLANLKTWAINARPGDSYFIGIKGFGIAGFQYLRMLFGAQAIKPDTHIIKFISDTIGLTLNDNQALFVLDKAANKIGYPLRDLDFQIWKFQSQKK